MHLLWNTMQKDNLCIYCETLCGKIIYASIVEHFVLGVSKHLLPHILKKKKYVHILDYHGTLCRNSTYASIYCRTNLLSIRKQMFTEICRKSIKSVPKHLLWDTLQKEFLFIYGGTLCRKSTYASIVEHSVERVSMHLLLNNMQKEHLCIYCGTIFRKIIYASIVKHSVERLFMHLWWNTLQKEYLCMYCYTFQRKRSTHT